VLPSPLHQCVPNLKSNNIALLAKLIVPKSQNFDTFAFDKGGSILVPRPLIWTPVATSVKFDSQAGQRAVKIKKVGSARILATEFECVEATIAQQGPHSLLGISSLSPEFAGTVSS
jgi:hypothetical protein